ncbi:hypothetical protein HDU83_001970 [Entophlyctis luteolus]|nr:hypothetical protein HDU83_001970 [Entophlyctis luteolus]
MLAAQVRRLEQLHGQAAPDGSSSSTREELAAGLEQLQAALLAVRRDAVAGLEGEELDAVAVQEDILRLGARRASITATLQIYKSALGSALRRLETQLAASSRLLDRGIHHAPDQVAAAAAGFAIQDLVRERNAMALNLTRASSKAADAPASTNASSAYDDDDDDSDLDQDIDNDEDDGDAGEAQDGNASSSADDVLDFDVESGDVSAAVSVHGVEITSVDADAGFDTIANGVHGSAAGNGFADDGEVFLNPGLQLGRLPNMETAVGTGFVASGDAQFDLRELLQLGPNEETLLADLATGSVAGGTYDDTLADGTIDLEDF